MKYFKYGEKEIEHLKEKDLILGEAIDEFGMIKRPVELDLFTSLIYSIIGQQISNKAASTVKGRFLELVGEVTPEAIQELSVQEIQACGMSMRKADYIKGIAEAALDGTVDFAKLNELSDKEVIEQLTQLKGVGIWTAEMLLLHSLHRADIVSYNDLAIRRGMKRLYNLDELSKKEFDLYKEKYTPYGSTASLYLWEISK